MDADLDLGMHLEQRHARWLEPPGAHVEGGGKFGRTANKAPAWAQDLIMYKTYKARGWSPWACQ